ncbi:expressed unknown protein [Seminavis robusta]|uniref:Uncharacterized protein n=1 Tax=Seminavis robusta TaxID=568900 RepID=A0A9N8DH19_9STRA|nr:expressed unknown protein [Seminavis robusta]|eukprot:Sro139_g064990.1 n/a (873) ;mRNA; f:20405-23375
MRRMRRSWFSSWSGIVPVVICLWLALLDVAQCQEEQRDARGNLQFDPDADNTKACWIPPYQNPNNYFQPRQGLCHNSQLDLDTISDESLHELAVAYAPVLYFHPLEKYTMSSVNYTLSNPQGGRIYRKTKEDAKPYVVDDTINATFMMETSRDEVWALNPTTFFFETDHGYEMYRSGPDERFGDGYDPGTGRSRAAIYYNVYDTGNHTWTFNYFMYYPYNGAGNMGVLAAYEGNVNFTRFTLAPYGIHEGDWESINVMVCAPTQDFDNHEDRSRISPPLAVKYHQHEWSDINDCTKGHCNFYKDTYHPVGFVAYNSHATYPKSTGNMIYENIEVGFFFSMQAFVIVDRTIYKKEDGTYNWFFPEVSSLERFQDPKTLQLDPSNSTRGELEQYYWQAYGGRWGNSKDVSVEPQPPLCLAPDQLSHQPCPTAEEDPVFDLAMQFMAVSPPKSDFTAVIQSVSSQVVAAFSSTGKAPIGPGSKGFWERWTPPVNAPFWNGVTNTSITAREYCEQVLFIDDTYRDAINAAKYDLRKEIIAIIACSCIITALNLIIPLGLMCVQRRHLYQPIITGEDGIPQDPDNRPFGHFHFMAGAIVFTLFFFLMITGGIFFIASCGSLFETLTEWIPNVNWSWVQWVIETLGAVVIVVNSILLFFLWLQAFEMRNMIRGTYNQLVQARKTESSTRIFRGEKYYVPWSPTVVEALFRICFALLFLSLLLSLLCVIVGFLAVGSSFTVFHVCSTVAGSLDHYCLDLDVLGIPKVTCGPDFQELCNDWAKVGGKDMLWSSFCAFVSHFYLVAAAAYASQQRRAIPAILSQYNFRSESLKKDVPPPERSTFVDNDKGLPLSCSQRSVVQVSTLHVGEVPLVATSEDDD